MLSVFYCWSSSLTSVCCVADMLLVTQLHCLPSLHNSVNGVVYCQFRNTVWSPFVGTLLTLIIDECLLNRTILFQAKGCGALHVIQNTACLPICSTKSDSGSFSNHGLAHAPCPNNKTNWWVQACAMKNSVVVMVAVHCDLWVSMNGARKCVDLNKMVMQFISFSASFS